MTKTVFRMLIVASALAGAVQVQAEAPILVEGRPTILVPFGDLDLSRPAGQASLNGRVRRAANRLCLADPRGVGPVIQERQCRDNALASARTQVDRAIALHGMAQYVGRSSVQVAGR
ncbi:MAG TPA: UrcA family protein [Allosphingosinicella sp.]